MGEYAPSPRSIQPAGSLVGLLVLQIIPGGADRRQKLKPAGHYDLFGRPAIAIHVRYSFFVLILSLFLLQTYLDLEFFDGT